MVIWYNWDDVVRKMMSACNWYKRKSSVSIAACRSTIVSAYLRILYDTTYSKLELGAHVWLSCRTYCVIKCVPFSDQIDSFE